METKIIEENNTGTVIIEDNASNENSAGGTQIIGETGTQIINEGGTQIISHDVPYMLIVAYHIHSSAFCISLGYK